MFVPNDKAIRFEIDKLLAKQHGGGKPTIDDACFTVSEKIYAEPNENARIFWRAVYNKLDAMRHEPKLARAVKNLIEASK